MTYSEFNQLSKQDRIRYAIIENVTQDSNFAVLDFFAVRIYRSSGGEILDVVAMSKEAEEALIKRFENEIIKIRAKQN